MFFGFFLCDNVGTTYIIIVFVYLSRRKLAQLVNKYQNALVTDVIIAFTFSKKNKQI